ncbi:MAG: FeoA family protein [Salibacteraceae bacterium]
MPDREGNVFHHKDLSLADLTTGESGVVVGVKDSSSAFLQHLESMGLVLGCPVTVKATYAYDKSMLISIKHKKTHTVSVQVSRNLYIKKHLDQ